MIELDVVDDGDVRQIFQKLRGLVEVRTVVLVAFDDEVLPSSQSIARSIFTKITRDPPDENARIEAAVHEEPSGQRRCRRFTVRAGDNDRAQSPQEVFTYGLRQRAIPRFAIEHGLELDVAPRDGIANDHKIDVAGDVLRVVAAQRADLLRRQERAHRRIHVLVRTLHVMSLLLEERGQCCHGRPANSDKVNRHATPASSIVTRGWPFATTRARTPNGRVTSGPRVCPDGKPCTTGPSKSLSRLASTLLAETAPPGSSQSLKSPSTIADARSTTPASRSCVSMRSIRNGRSLTSSRKSTWPSGGSNAYGVPSDATSCASVPPISGPAASPVLNVSSRGAASSPSGSVRVREPRNESRSYASMPRLSRRSSIGP